MNRFLNILLVEDNPGDARIVKEYLKEESSLQYNLRNAESLSEGLTILSIEKIDIILSDLGLPDSQGINTFYELRKSNSNIPIIIFTGINDNELGLEAVKMGAEDYLVKGQVGQQLLIRSINYAIERKKAENKQKVISRILLILNRPNEWHKIIKDILFEIKEFSGIEAVAIRIHKEDDYPYIDTFGFSPEFIETEKSLCIKDIKGNVVFDAEGKPVLACMCGNVMSGLTDSSLPFFTHSGSFWTNSTTKLLNSTTEKERQGHTRNRCNRDGYESVALIPVISGKETIGLIQLNDKRTDCFSLEQITFYEEIAATIGIAYKRVQIEKQVKESVENYRQLIDNMGEGIGITDNDENFIFVNPAAERIFEVEQGGLIGTSLHRFLSDEYLELVQNNTRERLDIKQSNSYELEIILTSGEKRQIIITATPKISENGDLVGTFGIFRDITERKLAEEALWNERKMLRTLIDNIPDAIYVKNTQGRKLISNPADLKYIGARNESEVIDKTDLELFPGKIGIRGHNDDMQIIKNGIPLINKSENFINEEGRLLWLLTTKVPLFDEHGNTSGLVGIGRDITELKRVEKELKTALEKAQEADRLKTNFLSTMSHELRTPLNAVIGFSSLIEKDTDLKDILDFGEMINSSGNQLLEIVENILDFSLIETGIVQLINSEFSINKMMEEIYYKILSQKEKINKAEIEIIYNPEIQDKNLMLYSDHIRVQQILIQLLNNALKFTKKGIIEFGFTKIINEGISMVKFYVKDTGIGISKDNQEIIFNIFRQADESNTRKYGGTGLGLSISKKLVEILGGKIWVETTPGEGSCFNFMIPLDIELRNIVTN